MNSHAWEKNVYLCRSLNLFSIDVLVRGIENIIMLAELINILKDK